MKNKLGVHALVWEAGWSHDECARAIAKSAEVGFDFIEASMPEPDEIDVDYTRRELEKNNLGINISFGLSPHTDITSPDKEIVARGRKHLEQEVRLARDLGASYICGILHSSFGKENEPNTPEGAKRSAEVLAHIAELAAASNITLGLEMVSRYESNLLNTAAQGVEFCKKIGAPNVKVHLDVYHMNIEEPDLPMAIRHAGPLLGYFHTGDSHRGYMGSGNIDHRAVFRTLAEIGYAGPITFESFSAKVVGQPLQGTCAIWREFWDDGMDLARHAMMFMRSQMKAADEANRLFTRSPLF